MGTIFSTLQDLGLQQLHEGAKEISARCPAHKRITGHEDAHPSWSINKTTGLHICYSCGWRGGLEDLFREVRGEVPDDLIQELHVSQIRASVRALTEEADEVEPDWSWEHEVSVSCPVPKGLRDYRRLTFSALDRFGVLWNGERMAWMLPFTMPDGTVYGAQYRVHGSELNLPEGVETKASLFGIDKMISTGRLITLVESPLDAVRLWQVGVPAVAAYGAWVSATQVELLAYHFNRVVLAMDADDAGRDSTNRLVKALKKRRVPYFRFSYPTYDPDHEDYVKDPGDFDTDDELRNRWNLTFSLSAHIKLML